MKPRSLRSLGPVKSSTFFLLKQGGVGGDMMEDRKQSERNQGNVNTVLT